MTHLPTVSRAGTHPNSLIGALCKARVAVEAAAEAMKTTAPNGRDYIGRPDDLQHATDVFEERLSNLKQLALDLEGDSIAISDAADCD